MVCVNKGLIYECSADHHHIHLGGFLGAHGVICAYAKPRCMQRSQGDCGGSNHEDCTIQHDF